MDTKETKDTFAQEVLDKIHAVPDQSHLPFSLYYITSFLDENYGEYNIDGLSAWVESFEYGESLEIRAHSMHEALHFLFIRLEEYEVDTIAMINAIVELRPSMTIEEIESAFDGELIERASSVEELKSAPVYLGHNLDHLDDSEIVVDVMWTDRKTKPILEERLKISSEFKRKK